MSVMFVLNRGSLGAGPFTRGRKGLVHFASATCSAEPANISFWNIWSLNETRVSQIKVELIDTKTRHKVMSGKEERKKTAICYILNYLV